MTTATNDLKSDLKEFLKTKGLNLMSISVENASFGGQLFTIEAHLPRQPRKLRFVIED